MGEIETAKEKPELVMLMDDLGRTEFLRRTRNRLDSLVQAMDGPSPQCGEEAENEPNPGGILDRAKRDRDEQDGLKEQIDNQLLRLEQIIG